MGMTTLKRRRRKGRKQAQSLLSSRERGDRVGVSIAANGETPARSRGGGAHLAALSSSGGAEDIQTRTRAVQQQVPPVLMMATTAMKEEEEAADDDDDGGGGTVVVVDLCLRPSQSSVRGAGERIPTRISTRSRPRDRPSSSMTIVEATRPPRCFLLPWRHHNAPMAIMRIAIRTGNTVQRMVATRVDDEVLVVVEVEVAATVAIVLDEAKDGVGSVVAVVVVRSGGGFKAGIPTAILSESKETPAVQKGRRRDRASQ